LTEAAVHLVVNASDLGRRRGGNESYLGGLIQGLAAVAPCRGVRVTLIAAAEGAGMARRLADPAGLQVVDAGPYRRVPFLLWQQATLLRQLSPDWYVSTFFLPPAVPGPCRAAVLIHDLSFRAHPEYFPRSIAAYMRLLAGLAIRQAGRVVALSEFTRRELLRFYPGAAGRVAVVYPGVGAEFQAGGDGVADERAVAALGVWRPYLLAVGNIHPRKNLGRLLDAWIRLRDGGRPVPPMAWAGLDRWGSEDLGRRAAGAGVRLIGFVPAESLPALYRQADALAYPSLYEGFGLPPLEAMACGTPVLASGATALPEAVGDAAVTADPADVGALASGLERVLFDEALRRDLLTRGLARAAQFRWEWTAGRLLDVLEEGVA
jgi:alpha-1,3-rhamnosyl/mannosyltransferase